MQGKTNYSTKSLNSKACFGGPKSYYYYKTTKKNFSVVPLLLYIAMHWALSHCPYLQTCSLCALFSLHPQLVPLGVGLNWSTVHCTANKLEQTIWYRSTLPSDTVHTTLRHCTVIFCTTSTHLVPLHSLRAELLSIALYYIQTQATQCSIVQHPLVPLLRAGGAIEGSSDISFIFKWRTWQ